MSPDRDLIFIVDGDHAVRDSLRFVIELDGMMARTCGNCRELLAHEELGDGCCAVVDGTTLSKDGPEILERLEARREILPVVLIVDHVSRRLLKRAIGAGLFQVVEKPVLDDALIRHVRLLRRRA